MRHGQYEAGESGSGGLTATGKRQARCLARYLARLPIEAIYSSDVRRAVETAEILRCHLGSVRWARHRLLREVLPTRIAGDRVPLHKRVDGARRIERILTKFFRIPRRARHEIVVCHGNLIRALVLRVASGRADGWQKLVHHHGAVTSFLISRRGIALLIFNGQEHLPRHLRTHS